MVGVNVVEEGASVDLFEVLCDNGVVDVSMCYAVGRVCYLLEVAIWRLVCMIERYGGSGSIKLGGEFQELGGMSASVGWMVVSKRVGSIVTGMV